MDLHYPCNLTQSQIPLGKGSPIIQTTFSGDGILKKGKGFQLIKKSTHLAKDRLPYKLHYQDLAGRVELIICSSCLVSANAMGDSGPVYAIALFSHSVVPMVLHLRGCGVPMIVTSLPMVAETVSMLHAKVKILRRKGGGKHTHKTVM